MDEWIEVTILTRPEEYENMNLPNGYEDTKCIYRTELVEAIMEGIDEGASLLIGDEWVFVKESYEDLKARIC